jgi:hypothetical protein
MRESFMPRKYTLTLSLLALLVPSFALTLAWAQPAAPPELHSAEEALKYLNGGDGTAEIEEGGHHWEFVRKGGSLSVRKVDKAESSGAAARFQVLSGLAETNKLDSLHNLKEFQEFLADPSKKVTGICLTKDDIGYIAEKDSGQLNLGKIYEKPKTMNLDQAVKGYQELCHEHCKGNLKKIADACVKFSKENRGRYPRKLDLLIPTYFKALPRCPGAEKVTYTFDVCKEPDRFTLVCSGTNHKGFCSEDYPQFTSLSGLKDD